MTILFVLALCIAGFVLGFIILYIMRRGYSKAKPANQEITENTEETSCLWCGKKEYSDTSPSFICPKCGTVHHKSCWEEYGGCTTWECPLAPTIEEARKWPDNLAGNTN